MGFLEVILAGVGFGFLGIFGRLAFSAGISIGELLVFRFGLAAIMLWTGLFFFRRDLLKMNFGQVIVSCLLGVAGYAVFSTMYFKAIQGVSVAVAAMLLFTFPIFVNIGAFLFLKERLHKKQWVSLWMSIGGLILLLWGKMSVAKVSAIFWGLGAAVTYAIYVLVSGKVQNKVHPISSSLYVISAASVALFLFHHPDLSRLSHFGWREYSYFLGIATIGTIMPLTLFLSGMQKISSSKASIVVMVEPVTAAIAGWFILGETLAQYQMAGALVVICALVLNR
ncbi:MAG: DMT family transporter [Pseudobdellovibrionaceae bacterium]